MPPLDLRGTNPLYSANADAPEELFSAVRNLPQWDQHCLQWADTILTEWVSDSLANAQDREGWAELHGLIQRLQTIQPPASQPEALRATTEAFYYRWDGMADLLAARAHRQDQHDPAEIASRAHMAELRAALSNGETSTQHLLVELKLSASRLSQLLSLAEGAGLVTRRKQGRERLVAPAGLWKAGSPTTGHTPASAPDGTGLWSGWANEKITKANQELFEKAA